MPWQSSFPCRRMRCGPDTLLWFALFVLRVADLIGIGGHVSFLLRERACRGHAAPAVLRACVAMGCTARTNGTGDRGLPWKTLDWTGKRAVCQPLNATLAVVPACRRLSDPSLRAWSQSYCCHAPLHPGFLQPVEGHLEVQKEKESRLLAVLVEVYGLQMG